MTALSLATTAPRIPLWLKLVYTAFMAVLVPVYLYYYGWTNFLYFCDVALILTLIAHLDESPLLVSMCAVGIIVPQLVWVIDFVGTARLSGRRHDRLHVQRDKLAVPARAFAVPRLAAVPADLSGRGSSATTAARSSTGPCWRGC